MRIFLSYARENRPRVEALATDLRQMDYEPFFDEQLAGGQAWWDQLLGRIEACDLFMPVLSAEYLESHPCALEAEYAHGLKKPFLPITIDTVSPTLFRSYLAEAQWVNYDGSDRNSIIELMRGLRNVSPAPPLPDPMPPRPAVPISYLTSYRELIDSPDDLTRAQQTMLLSDLRARLDSPDGSVVRSLLEKFAKRHDLVVTVADELNRMLGSDAAKPGHATAPTPPTDDIERDAGGTWREGPRRLFVAAAAVLVVVGVIAVFVATQGGTGTSSASSRQPLVTTDPMSAEMPPMQPEDEAIFHRIKEPGTCHHYNGTATYTGFTGVGLDCDTSNIGGYRAVYLQFDTSKDMNDAFTSLGFRDDLRGALRQCSNTSYPPPALNGGVHGRVHCPRRSSEEVHSSMCTGGNMVGSTMPAHDPKRIITELLSSCSALIATAEEGNIIAFAGSDTPDIQALYTWWIGSGYVGRPPATGK